MIKYLYPGCLGRGKQLLAGFLLSALLVTPAIAHLMVAQRGTLNIVDDGVFMVLSLPVSAFDNIDDDGDGKMSLMEFTQHRPAIVDAINEGVQLRDKKGVRPLEGMMLTPVTAHDAPKAPVDQLVVMGRFVLEHGINEQLSRELAFHLALFGDSATEQAFTVTAKYRAKSKKHKIELTPEQSDGQLFPDETDR